MYIEPLNKKVVLETITETVTEGGIIIPGKKDERPEKGLVLATSHDCDINVTGKTVLFNKFVGTEVEYKGKKYLIIKFEDIHAILN